MTKYRTATISPPAEEVLTVLNRAMNTWEDRPSWAVDLSDELQPGDEVQITIRRKVEEESTTSPKEAS